MEKKNITEELKGVGGGGKKQDPKLKTLFKLRPITFFFLLCNMTFFFWQPIENLGEWLIIWI